MFFPGVRRAFHVPHALLPAFLAIFAVFTGVTAWAVFARSDAGIEAPTHSLPDIRAIRSIAYTLPGEHFDEIVVRPADGSTAPRVIATFPSSGATGYHIHGAASPLGDRLAVISLPPFTGRGGGTLSIVSVESGEVKHVEGLFDYFSTVSWSPDGAMLAAVRFYDHNGVRTSTIVEIDVATGLVRTVAEFSDALDVVPVGYSFDSERLFIVAVDNRGSNLYVERAGKLQLEAELSPGRTRDWSLSPDGSRLAFIDVLAGGSRTFVGRTLVIATKTVTTLPASGDQLGTSWMPGSAVPAFGGPGGTWQLSNPQKEDAYVVPAAWAPDASYLVATVLTPTDSDSRSLELVARDDAIPGGQRIALSAERGAAFLGWVHNLN